MSSDPRAEDLPELPDLPDLPDLPEDAELPELPDLPVDPVGGTPREAPKTAPKPTVAARPAPQPPRPAPVKQEAPKPSPAPSKPSPAPSKPEAPKPEPASPAAGVTPASTPPAGADKAREEATLEPVGAGAAAPALADGERPPLRQLDKAPQHLRLAALIVLGGCLLPWMPGDFEEPSQLWWLMTLAAKALMLAAAWLWLQQVLNDWGPKLSGVLGQLASLHFNKGKADDDKKKARRKPANAPTTLEHPFPTGLHLLAAVLAIGAVVLAMRDPRQGLIGSNGIPEVAMLGWAAFTWVHIANYERWGGFNPLFPLMFLGMLLAGVMAVIGAVAGDAAGLHKLMGLAGGAAVAAGGGLAAYTIAEAMMQAKKEGDRKKADALEARRAARKKKD